MIEVRLSKISVGAQVSFQIKNSLKQEDTLTPLLIDFVSEVIIRKIQENKEGLILNGLNQVLAYEKWCRQRKGEYKNTIETKKVIELEVNLDKT